MAAPTRAPGGSEDRRPLAVEDARGAGAAEGGGPRARGTLDLRRSRDGGSRDGAPGDGGPPDDVPTRGERDTCARTPLHPAFCSGTGGLRAAFRK